MPVKEGLHVIMASRWDETKMLLCARGVRML